MTFIVRQIATTADGREIIRSNPFPADEIGIGRSTTNAIHLPDLAVNPDHAVIRKRDDGQIIVESTSGQNFTLDGKHRISVTIDPSEGAELGFGGHVITVSEEGEDIILTVKRVDAVSDSAETRSVSTLYTLKGLLPSKRLTAWGFVALILAAFLVWPIYTWTDWRGVEARPVPRRHHVVVRRAEQRASCARKRLPGMPCRRLCHGQGRDLSYLSSRGCA
jgi:hypothetical protein